MAMTDTDSYARLRTLLTDAGYAFVEPPIVYNAGVFVEVAGEDLRRRLFLTSGGDGKELTLRPDYTIPVCLHHLGTGKSKRKASYAYLGPVFRQRADGASEFLQAGIESLGRGDRLEADADVLQLAFAAAKELGVAKPTVRIGDSGLFAAVLDALDINQPWQRRLARSFGDTERLEALVARAHEDTPAADSDLAELAGADQATVRDIVADLFSSTGLGVIGGRGAEEIAERFVEKAVLAQGIDERATTVLSEYLAIAGKPTAVEREIGALARRARLGISEAIDRFAKRSEAFEKRDIDLNRLSFAADFGRRLDYYTGFVFEFHRSNRSRAGPIIGGGRYDRLMSLVGAKEAVPAVGFAIWLDRIGVKR